MGVLEQIPSPKEKEDYWIAAILYPPQRSYALPVQLSPLLKQEASASCFTQLVAISSFNILLQNLSYNIPQILPESKEQAVNTF